MSLMNKVCVNIDQSNSATGGFTDAEKAQARTNIGAGTGNGNSDIARIDVSGNEYDVDKLSIYQRSVSNAEFKDGSTTLGSTVPTPSMASNEGKVPVAYYRDGRGYFLLEQYKDPRIPDSSSSNVNQALIVDSHGVANWTENNSVKYITTSNTFAEVKALYDAGFLVVYKRDSIYWYTPTYVTDDYIYFGVIAQRGARPSYYYNVYIAATDGWHYTSSYQHPIFTGYSCNVNNFEAHDTVMKINGTEWTIYPNQDAELTFDYFSYHAGSFGVTAKMPCQIYMTGMKRQYRLDTTVTPYVVDLDKWTPIEETLTVSTADSRVSLPSIFMLDQQELAHSNYRIEWDFLLRFRKGPFYDQTTGDETWQPWTSPLHIKLEKTPTGIILAGN